MNKLPAYRPVAWMDLLCDYLSSKNLLLAGCVGDTREIKAKLKANAWLPQRLEEVSKCQMCIEKSDELTQYMREWLGFSNTLCEHIGKPGEISPVIKEKQWDCLVVGSCDLEPGTDLLEWFKMINRRYRHYVRELILLPPAFNGLPAGGVMQVKSPLHGQQTHQLHKQLAEASFFPVQHPRFNPDDDGSGRRRLVHLFHFFPKPHGQAGNHAIIFARFTDPAKEHQQ